MLGLARFVTHGSGGSGPSLNFNFADNSPYLSQQITFTRASAGTFVGSDGLIQNAPVNLLTYSEQFDNAVWVKVASTVTLNAAVAPDGSTTADALIANTANLQHRLELTPVSPAGVQTFSVYAKASGYSLIAIRISLVGAVFDLSTGNYVSSLNTPVSYSSTSVGNGWYRLTVTVNASANDLVRINVTNNSLNNPFVGDGTSGIFIWGAQLVEGSVAGPYARTVASTSGAPRFDYDPVTLAAKGLLIEEQRTNLLLRSEEFDNAAWTKNNEIVTANTHIAPDGSLTADTVTANSALAGTNTLQAVSGLSAGATVSFSVYAKRTNNDWLLVAVARGGVTTYGEFGAWFDLANGVVGASYNPGAGLLNSKTITNCGNGWYLITVVGSVSSATAYTAYTAAVNANSSSATTIGNSRAIWGAQLEAGSFATSYIPTVASQVTRSADVASVNTLSPWYNATEGTLYVETGPTADNIYPTGAVFTDGTTSNNILIQGANPATSQQFYIVSGGVVQVNLATQTFSSTLTKTAAAYKANDFAYSTQGAAVSTDVAGSVPTVSQLVIGAERTSSLFNGTIRRITYYPRRLPNATLQQITS